MAKQMQTIADPEKLVYKPMEAARAIGISLPVMYDLCKRSDFPAVRFGRAIVIPKGVRHVPN